MIVTISPGNVVDAFIRGSKVRTFVGGNRPVTLWRWWVDAIPLTGCEYHPTYMRFHTYQEARAFLHSIVDKGQI